MKEMKKVVDGSSSVSATALSAAPVSLVFALSSCALALVVAAELGLSPVRAVVSACAQRRYALGLVAAAMITLGSAVRIAAGLHACRRRRLRG